MAKVVGIDLGMTNFCVAVMEGDKPTVIANAEGFRSTPSVVAFAKNGDRPVGQIAKRQAVMNCENTFYSVKRFIGRKYDEVASEAANVSYQVLEDSEGKIKLKCASVDTEFSPEEIYAQVLRKLVNDASKYLGEPVTQAVFTVPAYFNDQQRQATKDAGKIAGIEVLRIINEPTAASLAYGLNKKSNETILVFDLSGGTCDVSILEVGDGVFEVLATSSNPHLGGDDFDQKIVNWLTLKFQRTEGVDLRQNRQVLQRLLEAAETAKIDLSSITTAEINLPFITATEDGQKHLDATLTRSQFEEMCSDLLDGCRILIEQTLKEAKLTVKDIDEVVLVGGSTYIPAVQELVRRITGKELSLSINPNEVVAIGAAIQASILGEPCFFGVILDIVPLSVGIETIGGVMTRMIQRRTTIPTKKSAIVSTAMDAQTSVEIHIIQGERELAKDNKSLGILRLDGIAPAKRGVAQIEVNFEIDANCILSVSAKDLATGKQQSISITAANVDYGEVEHMLKVTRSHAVVDRKLREQIDARNRAEILVYQAHQQLTELSEKAFVADNNWIQGVVKHLQAAMEKQDCDRGYSLGHESQIVMIQLDNVVQNQAVFFKTISNRTYSYSDNSDDDLIDAEFTEAKAL